MTDREKIIKGLECCHVQRNEVPPLCEDCPYMNPMEGTCDALDELLGDALTLLKALEPKPPLVTENAYGWKFYHCPSCGREFYGDRLHGRMNKTAFCDKCGQAVKWE